MCKLFTAGRLISYLEHEKRMDWLPGVLKLRRPHIFAGYADNKCVQRWLWDWNQNVLDNCYIKVLEALKSKYHQQADMLIQTDILLY